MMTLPNQMKFTFNSLLEDIRGSRCCVIKVCQYIIPFSNDHNIVSSLISGGQNKPPMEFLDPFLQVSKSEFRFRW